MLAFMVLFCFRVSVGAKSSSVVLIDNILSYSQFLWFVSGLLGCAFYFIFARVTQKSLMKALPLGALWDLVFFEKQWRENSFLFFGYH